MAIKKYEITVDVGRVDSGSINSNSPALRGLLSGFRKDLLETSRQKGSYHLRVISVSVSEK